MYNFGRRRTLYIIAISTVHTYLEKFPDVAGMRGKGAEGDVVDRIISKLKGMLKGEGVPEDSTLMVDVAMVLLLYRKPSAIRERVCTHAYSSPLPHLDKLKDQETQCSTEVYTDLKDQAVIE